MPDESSSCAEPGKCSRDEKNYKKILTYKSFFILLSLVYLQFLQINIIHIDKSISIEQITSVSTMCGYGVRNSACT